jgi:transcriptional regulator with XRE-family HTH domain
MATEAPQSPHNDLTTGERIRLLRNRKHLTLRQLASEVGVHFTTLAAYERDEASPPGEVLRRVALTLGCSTDYLLRLRDKLDQRGRKVPVRAA